MDKRTLLAISLSFLIFMGWQKFYIEPRLPKPVATAPLTGESNAPAASSSGSPTSFPVSSSNAVPSEEIAFKTSVAEGKAGNSKKFFTQFELPNFTDSHKAVGTKVTMSTVTPEIPAQIELAFDNKDLTYLNSVSGKFSKVGNDTVWTFEDERVSLKRTYQVDPNLPFVNVQMSAVFKSVVPQFAFLSLETEFPAEDPEQQDRQMLAYTMGSLERKHLKDLKPVEDIPGPIEWIGAQNRYFLLGLIPARTADIRALSQISGTTRGRLSLVFPVSGKEWNENVKVYFGPKQVDILKEITPTLSKTVDFGVFTVVATPIMHFMKWLYTILGNWGLAIIVLTLVIKIATFPLTYKSMKSMKNMAKMQPELEKLRTQYKDDKETLNRELMAFMKTKGYNPVSGCLPILIQMPVFFALYRVLYSSIELYQSPFFFWIKDLSLKDPFYITPIILTGVMWLQQKLTPNTVSDPMQAKMMQFMPLFFGFMMISLPAGLTLYMLVNALASIAQQLFINSKLDVKKQDIVVLDAAK